MTPYQDTHKKMVATEAYRNRWTVGVSRVVYKEVFLDMFKVFNGKDRFIDVQKEKYKDGRVKVHRVTQRVSHHHLSLSLSQPPPSVTIIITAKSRCTHQQGYFFLNVGRDPIGKEHETYCTMAYIEQEVEDKVQSVLYKAGHYAPAVADLYTGITSYCDSSGWAMPQLRVILANLNGDFDISMVQAHNSSTTSYKNKTQCLLPGNRHRLPCSKFYPLYICSTICGVCVMIFGALAAFDFQSFDRLLIPRGQC